jgi:hypothetical protein
MQSNLVIEDVYFKNFNGVTSGKYDPIVGTIVCSSPDVSISEDEKNCNPYLILCRFVQTSMPVVSMLPVLMATINSLAQM